MAYRIDGARLTGGRIFAEVTPGIPDGITTDEKGNVWSSSKEGVHVFSGQGVRLGRILIPSEDTGRLAWCRRQKVAVRHRRKPGAAPAG